VSDTKQAEASEREKWKALCALPQFGPRFENSDGSWEWRHELLPEVRDRILALATENAELRDKLATVEREIRDACAQMLRERSKALREIGANADADEAWRCAGIIEWKSAPFNEAATRKEPQP
jgi:hypothetical protein